MKVWYTTCLAEVRRYRYILSLIFILAVFCLLAWRLYYDWHALPVGFFQDVDYSMLSGSLVCLMGALLLVSFRWRMTLRALGESISWRANTRIWFLSQAGRYLPGGIWSYVGRFYLSKGEMRESTAILSMLLETMLRVLSEVLVFLFTLPFWPNRELLGNRALVLLTLGVIAGLSLLHPALIVRIGRSSWPRRIGVNVDAETLASLKYRTLLGLLMYYIATVIGVGVAFYLLVKAIYPLTYQALPALTGGLSISVVLGFLVPLAPGGWGVREGVLAFLLAQIVPSPIAIIVSVASRFWLSLAEGVWILVALRL